MKESTKDYYQTSITRAINYIENNINEPLRLDKIANIAHLSSYHFHRLFKAFTNSTLSAYITRIRLEKAAILLKSTTQSIATIGYQCGFNQPESFSRAFSSYFNLSPSDFRDKQKTINENKKKTFIKSNHDHQTMLISSPAIINIKPIPIAYIRHNGPYEQVGETWKKLITWGYKNWKLGWKIKMYGISHDSPEITTEEHIRYDACIGIRKSFTPKGEVGFKLIEGGTYAVFEHQGPYSELNSIYDYIYSVWILEENKRLAHKPAFEQYMNSPQRTKPECLKTKIFIPLN